MKRFRFRLQRLLELREASEAAQAHALLVARVEEEAQQQQYRARVAELERMREQLNVGPSGAIPAGALQNLGLTTDAADENLRAAEASHAIAEKTVEAERERFERARVERRVVERLREHRKTIWRGDHDREEQKQSDEAALSKHGMREPGS